MIYENDTRLKDIGSSGGEHEECLEAQFGLGNLSTAIPAITQLRDLANGVVTDEVIKDVEGAILLLTNLSQQTTALGALTAIGLYVRAYSTASVSKVVMDYVSTLFMEQQDGFEAVETPKWLECLQSVRNNWKLARSNKAFGQISKLLGILVCMGVCKASDVDFQIGPFKVFESKILERHMTATDFGDAVCDTVIFFAEGAYMCFKTGSLKPLLLNDWSATKLDDEYFTILGMWDLVQNGNLEAVMEKTDHEFDSRIQKLSQNLRALSESLSGLDKKLVLDKFEKINRIRNDFVTAKLASGIRRAPFGIEFFGESNQGKTTCGDQIVDALLASQGLPLGKEYRNSVNASDNYLSGWKTDKLVMTLDDFSNDKSNFVSQPPTRMVIDVMNNDPYIANMADLASKGKVFVEPEVVVVTTNKKDLDAGVYSNCPYSIQRRLICVTVSARDQFQKNVGDRRAGLDSDAVFEFYTDPVTGEQMERPFDDIWDITIEEAVMPEKLSTVAKYVPVWFDDREMINVNMSTTINYFIDAFDKHRRRQKMIVENKDTRLSKPLDLCGLNGCKQIRGYCLKHRGYGTSSLCSDVTTDADLHERKLQEMCDDQDLESEFGQQWDQSTIDKYGKMDPHFGVFTYCTIRELSNKCSKLIQPAASNLDLSVASALYNHGAEFLENWDWLRLMPAPLLQFPWVRKLFLELQSQNVAEKCKDDTNRALVMTFYFALTLFAMLPWKVALASLPFLGGVLAHWLTLQKERVEEELFKELSEKSLKIETITGRMRTKHVKIFAAATIGAAGIYALVRLYRVWKECQEVQGSLDPKTIEEVKQRDSEKNEWAEVLKRPLPATLESKCITYDRFANKLNKNLMYAAIKREDGQTGCANVLFLKSNVMVLPHHYFDICGEEFEMVCRRDKPDTCGGSFRTAVSIHASVLVEGTDLRVCYSPTGGSYADLTKYLPTAELVAMSFKMHYRQRDGEVLVGDGRTKPGKVLSYDEFIGGTFDNLSFNTFKGLCGAPLVSHHSTPMIIGCHVAGIADSPRGGYCSLTQEKVNVAISALEEIDGVLITGSAGEFKTTILDNPLMIQAGLHAKSALNYMPAETQIRYHGECVGKESISKSDVIVSPISASLIEHCDMPNVYQAPKMLPSWWGYQKCLSKMARPAKSYPHSLVLMAVKDYKAAILPLFEQDMWKDVRPLTDRETLNGIAGERFIDAMRLSTSSGVQFGGKKSKYIIEGEPDEKGLNRRFTPEIEAEIKRVEECYKRGERAYCVAKACKKDEILTKERCRMFFGNSLILTFMIRKYYLPIMRVLQMHPLRSECAVGINCHGPEWEEFYQHAVKHGIDRLMAGDYKDYDASISAQQILISLRLLIDCARKLIGYTGEHIVIMKAMSGDIVFAYIAIDGSLISVQEGSHISGNGLTVIINSICGCINLRCYFYSMYPYEDVDLRRAFQDFVAMMTYGDDNLGSVSPEETRFTIKGFSVFLAEYGQTYTMPDKDSELMDFLPPEEFEFLKRKSVYIPEIGAHVGALVEKSIFKSLHCLLWPKGRRGGELEASAENMDTALREYFNHGREIYEARRLQFRRVAEDNGITNSMATLEWTFDDRVAEWKEKYLNQPRVFEVPHSAK